MSRARSDDDFELFADLQALSESAFPKECGTCGRVYHSSNDFIRKARPPATSTGLKEGFDDDDQNLVELYRNCDCGSTLMDYFLDRRDTSTAGLKRREVFGRLLDKLVQKGLGRDLARAELLNLMKGNPSGRLEALGVNLKRRTSK